MPITEVSLPFLHPKVDLVDLYPNRKLLSDEEIAEYKSIFQSLPDGRFRKKDYRFLKLHPNFVAKYGIIKFGDELFAIYKGRTHNKHIYYDDSHKKVKLSQELNSGNWYALKIEASPLPNLIQLKDNVYEVNNAAIKSKYDAVKNEFNNTITYGTEKLYPKGHLLQRVSKARTEQHPESSLHKITHSFLMPLLPGLSLINFLDEQYKLSTYRWLEIALKMLLELKSFHQRELLHRDIKLENIIYNYFTHEVTIIDLEFTRKMDRSRHYFGTLSGTLLYLAPEITKHFRDFPNSPNRKDYLYDEYTEAYAAGIALKILFSIPVRLAPELKPTDKKNQNKPEFYKRGHEKEIKSLASIRALLDNLTSTNHLDRDLSADPVSKVLLFDSIIAYLEPILDEAFKSTEVKTAIIEINETIDFFKQASLLERERFLFSLQQFDEICLVSIDDKDNDYYFPLVKLQRLLADKSMAFKIPYFRNLLLVPNMKAIAEIVAYFKNIEEPQASSQSQSSNGNPRRTFTYFHLRQLLTSADYGAMIENGINIIAVNEKKSHKVYLENISDGMEAVSGNDYAYIIRAMETECQRLFHKYHLDSFRNKEEAIPLDKSSQRIVLANYRNVMLKNTLDNIVNLPNLRLTYAAVSTLLSLLTHNDATFAAAPTNLFSHKSTCVVNVEKIQTEIERRRAPLRKL
jgi:serine/threonine protein kinase